MGLGGKTTEQVLDWLRENKGGPENEAYWLPAEAPDGTKLKFLQSDVNGLGGVEMSPVRSEGVYLDRFGFLAGKVHYSLLSELNLNGGLRLVGDCQIYFGPILTDNGHIVWVMANGEKTGAPSSVKFRLFEEETRHQDPGTIDAGFNTNTV